ncbi:MAG: DNRLRE domain-containing protein [Myxococcales bacterium]|nr:DNRLRE domain-containing protein [Myxococcales bacterium]
MRRLVLVLGLISALSAAANGPRRVTLQRTAAATPGPVQDCYVWQESPDYNGNSDTLYVGQVGATDKESFLRFDVSSEVAAGQVVVDARLVLGVMGTNGQPIRVHEVTAAWGETEPTWATFGASYASTAVTQFTPEAGRVSVPLTSLVQGWVDGKPNHGVALVQDTLTPSTEFFSSDHPTLSVRPALELVIDEPPAPEAPLVASAVPALEASCGVPFLYPLQTHAPGATAFSVSSDDGVVVGAASGELSWTPDRTDRGSHEWMVQVSDGARQDALRVQVEVRCSEPLHVGCSSAPGGALAMLGVALLALRRPQARCRRLSEWPRPSPSRPADGP